MLPPEYELDAEIREQDAILQPMAALHARTHRFIRRMRIANLIMLCSALVGAGGIGIALGWRAGAVAAALYGFMLGWQLRRTSKLRRLLLDELAKLDSYHR